MAISNGAQPSDTASSLIKKARILSVDQAVAGKVTEEEFPVATVDAEDAIEAIIEENS